jgi:hypothetical protein
MTPFDIGPPTRMRRAFPFLIFALTVLCIFRPWWQHGLVCAPLDIAENLYEPWANTEQPVTVKNHFATDAPDQYLPYHSHISRSFLEEGRYGWNYLKYRGTPACRNTMTTPGDWTLQLYRWMPFWQAWHWGLMGQLLVAMLGMYRLLRAHRASRGLSVLGGLAFGLNAHFFAWLYHRWTLGSFCWTPWWLWAFGQLRLQKKAGLLTPVFLALSILGGHLQFAAVQALVFATIAIVWLAECRRDKVSVWKPAATSAAVGLLACGLAAFVLVPTIMGYLNTTAAGLKRGMLGYPEGYLTPLFNALLYPVYAFPFPMGRPPTLDLFKLFRSDLVHVPFFGTILMIFGFVGLWNVRISRTARFLAAAGLLLPLTPLVGFLYLRLLIIWVVGGIWVAVLALERTADQRLCLLRRWLWRGFLVGSALLLVVGAVAYVRQRPLTDALTDAVVRRAQEHRFHARPDWFAHRAAEFIAEIQPWRLRIAAPWLLFGGAVFLLRYRRRKWFGYALALLVAPQVWLYSSQWIVFHEPRGVDSAFMRETAETEALRRIVGKTGRVYHSARNPGRLPLFPPNTLSAYDIPSLTGYDSIIPRDGKLMSRAKAATPESLGELGVTHLVAFVEDDISDPDWTLVERVGKIAIYSNVHAVAWYRAETARGAIALQPDLHSHNRRLLRIPPGTRNIRIMEYWGDDWETRVDDGEWVRIRQGEESAVRIELTPSADEQRVEFVFSPRDRSIGSVLSVVAIFLYSLFAVGRLFVFDAQMKHAGTRSLKRLEIMVKD